MTANHDLQPEVAKCEAASSLLQEFGARLGGWSPGVMFYVGSNEQTTINLDSGGWAWLEPLLVELRDRRRAEHGQLSHFAECWPCRAKKMDYVTDPESRCSSGASGLPPEETEGAYELLQGVRR